MKKYLILSILIVISIDSFSQQKYTISGFVNDNENGESLIGVNVIVQEKLVGTTSNTYGFYSLTLPEGSYEISFTYIGFETLKQSVNLNKNISLNVDLISSSTDIGEVTIVAEETVVERTQTSIVEVPVQLIKNIPALLGEVDVLKAIQLLPGVQSGGEGTSGFYVRGGGPDQNLILLDGVPVYNASHLFGFFSVFNADAIKNVRLTKGGFPARFGGRLSSVLEIDMKEGNMKKIEGEGSIGLISSKLTLQGPIIKDKTSFIVSGRRTYIDILAQPFIRSSNDGNPAGYYFYDLNAKLNHKFSEKDRLYLSAYLGKDRFYLSEGDESSFLANNTNYQSTSRNDFGLDWGNITSSLRWNHLFSNKLFANTTLTYSKYQFNTIFDSYTSEVTPYTTDTDTTNFNYFSGVKDYGAKFDFDYLPNPNHYIKFGLNYVRHNFYPGSLVLYLSSYERDSLGVENYQVPYDTTFNFSEALESNDAFFYVEDDIKVNDQLKVNLGMHLGYFNTNNKTYYSFQPRFSSRYLINKDWSLKASYAEMQQNIHLLTGSGAGLPTDIWVPSTDSVPPQYSKQVAFAANKNFLNGLIEVSIEGYYKSMSDLITLKPGAEIIGFDDWKNKVDTNGIGRSYGAELFIQKKKGKTTGWIGYTLSFSERKFEGVNFGKWYPYKFDRRHDFSLVMSHEFSDNFDIGLTWVYGTGNNMTFLESRYPSVNINGNINGIDEGSVGEIEYYPTRNNLRLPSYHRLDIGLNFHKKKKWGDRTISVGAYNVYNRKNPFFLSVNDKIEVQNGVPTSTRVVQQTSLFPIIPSISYKFKF
ncbi:MAG: TonB-dependent receptor [Flavobacteriales bacterium]